MFEKKQKILVVKKSKKAQREPSNETAALDKRDKSGWVRGRNQKRNGSKRLGSKTGQGLEQVTTQVAETNELSDSTDLQELEGLVKQVEMLKNKMRDLFIRAQEMQPRD